MTRNVARTSIVEPAEQATVGRNVCITCGDVAIAMRVVEIAADGLARCVTEPGDGSGGEASEVDVSLLDVAPGDRVLVHACVAIARAAEEAVA